MPKVKMQCAGCGKEFMAFRSDRTGKATFCTRECYMKSRPGRRSGGFNIQAQWAWNAFNRMPFTPHPAGGRYIPFATCYLKEARAILAGTKTRINRCKKLVGDD